MIGYILKVSLCWLFFYGVYELLLKKKTFFNANRSYLLTTLIAGMLLPLLEFIPWKNESNVAYAIYPILMEIDDLQAVVAKKEADNFNWLHVLYFIYAVGFIISLSRFSLGIKRILELYRGAQKSLRNGYTLVMTDQLHLPFSFFKWVFFSSKMEFTKDVQSILDHEIEHIKGKHSLDVLATELLKVIFWCSPMIYLYKNALKEVHEFLADRVVVKKSDKIAYKKLLLDQTNSGIQMALTHQFFNSHLKNRIKMINQKRSGRPTLVMYALGIPVLLLLTFAFTYNFKVSDTHEGSIPDLVKNIGTYYTEEDAAKAPYFQIDGEDIKLPLSNHISLYQNIGNATVLLPEDAVKQYGEKAKLGYINFDHPRLKNETRRMTGVNPKMVVESYPKVGEARKELLIEKGSGYEKYERDYVPSAGKNMTAALMAGIKKKYTPVDISTDPFNGDLEQNFDRIARINLCSEESLDANEEDKCAMKEMIRIVYDNLEYPEQARASGLYGSVSIMFVVTKEGKLENFEIYKDIGGECGYAALAASKKLRNYQWNPAVKDGKAVNMRYFLPITFELTEEVAGINKELVVDLDTIPSKIPNHVSSPDIVFKVVEQMPRFPGCESEEGSNKDKEDCAKQKMLEFIYGNLKYPNDDRIAGVEGMAVAQFTVREDGSLEDIKIVRELSTASSKEVVRTIESMNSLPEKWTPGFQRGQAVNVRYILPVKFKIHDEKNEEEVDSEDSKEAEEDPIVYLDGELFTQDLESIDAETIKSMNVLKGEKAIEAYGQAGKNGVIEITSKTSLNGQVESALDKKVENEGKAKKGLVLKTPNQKKQPLFVVDGEELPELNREELNPDDIKEMFVLKGEKATDKYGDKGLNGVVEITTKKGGVEKNSKQEDDRLYFVDGEESTVQEVEKISGDNKIASMKVLKGASAREKYGDRGVNGVIEIITKTTSNGKVERSNEKTQVNDPLYLFGEPLYIVDGKEIKDKDFGMETMNPEIISSINVLRGEEAKSKYGDKGRNGVIEISTKKVKNKINSCDDLTDEDEKNRCRASKAGIVKDALGNIGVTDRVGEELALENLAIFPNPARESVNLKFSAEKKPTTIQILNLEGKAIYTKNIQNFNGNFEEIIDLKNNQSKILVIFVEQEGKVYTEKLIVE